MAGSPPLTDPDKFSISMKEIVFVRTRWQYQSYSDFWKLVELSGFPFCYVDEMDVHNSKKLYIVSPMNGEWIPYVASKFPKGRRNFQGATLMLWNLERPDGTNSYTTSNMNLIKSAYLDEVLVSDKMLAYHTGFQFVPLGSHAGLGTPGSVNEKAYDVIHLSCYSNHRSFLFQTPSSIRRNIDGMTVANNGWGESRDENLRQSRFMLNIHQDDFPYVEPLRFAVAAAYGLPVITEELYDGFPYEGYYSTIFGTPSETVLYHKNRYNSYWYTKGLEFRKYMTESYSFRRCLELCL